MTLRIGHRGAAGHAPENTLASFKKALEQGAQGVEFDVHRTADGHLVVIHDALLDRTTNGSGLIRGKTLAEIKALDAGSWKGAAFAGERVPTLAEVAQATGPDCRLFIELKAGSLHYPGIESDLVQEIHRLHIAARTQVSSFDHHALHRIRELDAHLPTAILFECNLMDPVGAARACGATALHPHFLWVTPEMLLVAKKAGLAINTWTVNDPAFIAQLKQAGVDGIMSDFPDRLEV